MDPGQSSIVRFSTMKRCLILIQAHSKTIKYCNKNRSFKTETESKKRFHSTKKNKENIFHFHLQSKIFHNYRHLVDVILCSQLYISLISHIICRKKLKITYNRQILCNWSSSRQFCLTSHFNLKSLSHALVQPNQNPIHVQLKADIDNLYLYFCRQK